MNTLTIPAFDEVSAKTTQTRMDILAKVPGSLGRLEDLAVQLAGITGQIYPLFPKKTHVLFAGDHDIALQGVSATGQEITALQVRNFIGGGGAINAFCRTSNAELTVVDVGVKHDLTDLQGYVNRNIVKGVKDFSKGPAMTREEAVACVQVGIDIAREKAAQGVNLLSIGEMGIGNTSPSSAITAVMTGLSVAEVTGMGSGISAERMQYKIQLIQQGIDLNRPDPKDALDVLAKVGGAEIGAMAGLMLGGASLRIPVVVDGFIAGAAAAIALGMHPALHGMFVGSHTSQEPGHQCLITHLKMPTHFDLGLRLGEGTGALLMFPLIDVATRILHEMTTLEDLGLQL